MATPKAVLDQLARAEELHRQAYNPDPDKDTPAQEPASAEDPNKAAEPEHTAHPEAAPDTGHAENDVTEQLRKLQAAHATLQGKYTAEVPRLTQENRQLREQLDAAQAKAKTAEESAEKARTDLAQTQARLRDEFGDDAADAVSEMARQIASEEVGKYQQSEQERAQERFMASVRRYVADFDQVNTSPEFLRWLATPDPATGFPYQDALNRAGQALDVFAVADVFEEFKREKQPPKPRAPSPEDHLAAPKAGTRTPQEMKRPAYTPDDFTRLQREIQNGMWKGRMAEARQLEAEIHAALTGG